MTRQEAYVAELNQLLFYMTPWDKAEVLKGITAMINHPETGVQTMEEMGSPMKLAVTLHRQYTPTPEPTAEELAAKAAAVAAEEVPAEELNEAAEVAVEEESAEEAEAAEEAPAEEAEAAEEAPAEEAEAAEEAPAEEAEAAEEEPAEEAEAAEEAPADEVEAAEEVSADEVEAAEEVSAEEAEAAEEVPAEEAEAAAEETPAEEALFSSNYVDQSGQESIFAEIFNAVEEAQAAPVIEAAPVKEIKRKARYLFLIPYVIFAVVVGVPATLVFGVANLAVLCATLLSLSGAIYLALFGLGAAVGLSSKLIVFGLAILMLTLTIALGVMTVWFLRTATAGFPRFLVEVAKTHGYREVEVQ